MYYINIYLGVMENSMTFHPTLNACHNINIKQYLLLCFVFVICCHEHYIYCDVPHKL